MSKGPLFLLSIRFFCRKRMWQYCLTAPVGTLMVRVILRTPWYVLRLFFIHYATQIYFCLEICITLYELRDPLDRGGQTSAREIQEVGFQFQFKFQFYESKNWKILKKKSLLVSLLGYMVHYTHWLLRIILLNPVFSSRYSVRSKIWFGQKKKTYDYTADDFMSHWLFQIL